MSSSSQAGGAFWRGSRATLVITSGVAVGLAIVMSLARYWVVAALLIVLALIEAACVQRTSLNVDPQGVTVQRLFRRTVLERATIHGVTVGSASFQTHGVTFVAVVDGKRIRLRAPAPQFFRNQRAEEAVAQIRQILRLPE